MVSMEKPVKTFRSLYVPKATIHIVNPIKLMKVVIHFDMNFFVFVLNN